MELATLRRAFWEALPALDGVLTLPAPDVAPGRDTTGPAHYLIPWTALHGPLVVVPGPLSERGLPMATLVAAPPGKDAAALVIASDLARAVGTPTPRSASRGQ